LIPGQAVDNLKAFPIQVPPPQVKVIKLFSSPCMSAQNKLECFFSGNAFWNRLTFACKASLSLTANISLK